MKILAAMILTLVLALPASAEFTAAEKTQINNLRVAGIANLTYAFMDYQHAMVLNQDTLAIRRSAILHTNRAMREAASALSRLVDVVTMVNFQVPSPATRAQRVADAMMDLDQAEVHINYAIVSLNGAKGANLLRARNMFLPNARTALHNINRNLSYMDPRPPSYPMLIGPHGNYDKTVGHLARSWAYNLDIVDFAFNVYGQGSPAPNANWSSIIQASWDNYRVFADGLALMAGVGDLQTNQFWRILNFTAKLTNFDGPGGAVAGRYMALLNALTVQANPVFSGLITRVGESWKFMDLALWHILDFPNCNMTSDPAGCAASLP